MILHCFSILFSYLDWTTDQKYLEYSVFFVDKEKQFILTIWKRYTQFETIVDVNGNKRWHVNGKLHRNKLHAVEMVDGTKCWCVNGKLHRDNLPAVKHPNGNKTWYKHGKMHRDGDLPAIDDVHPTINKIWFKNGKIHRDGNYAVSLNGDLCWYKDGKPHRDNDLPAIHRKNGIKEWWVNGIEIFPNIN